MSQFVPLLMILILITWLQLCLTSFSTGEVILEIFLVVINKYLLGRYWYYAYVLFLIKLVAHFIHWVIIHFISVIWRVQMIAAYALACIIERQPEFREPESFVLISMPALCSRGRCSFRHLRLFSVQTSLTVWKKQHNVKKCNTPMENCLSVSVAFLPTGDVYLTFCHLLQSGLST